MIVKHLIIAALLIGAAVAEPEGVLWYDSEGKLALVESKETAAASRPFIPEWRQRELQRDSNVSSLRSWGTRNRVSYRRSLSWPVAGSYYRGGFVPVRFSPRTYGFGGGYSCYNHYRPISPRGRVSVIFRW